MKFKCPICGKIREINSKVLVGQTNIKYECLHCKTKFDMRIDITPYQWNEKYDNIIDDIFNGMYRK